MSAGAPVRADAEVHAEVWRQLEDCPVGLLRVHDGCVAEANAALRAIAGRGDALRGQKLDDLLEDIGRGLPREAGPAALECALVRPDGTRRALALRRAAWRLGPGTCWWVEDATSRRDLEAEILRAGRELATANRDVEGASGALRRARGARGAPHRGEPRAAHAADRHDGLHPPAARRGGRPAAPGAAPLPRGDAKACTRLDRFVANLLEAARVQKGGLVLELGCERVDLAIEGVAEMFRPLFVERQLTRRTCASSRTPPRASTACASSRC